MTAKEERKIHPISENLGVTSDGSMNIILMERYEKQEGKGKNAPKTGEYDWRPLTGGAYFSNPKSLAHGLFRRDFVEGVGEVGLDEEKLLAELDKKLALYEKFFSEHITLELAKVKDMSKKEDDTPVVKSK